MGGGKGVEGKKRKTNEEKSRTECSKKKLRVTESLLQMKEVT